MVGGMQSPGSNEIEAEYEVVEDPYNFPWGRVLRWIFFTGTFAWAAYTSNDRSLAVVFVITAAFSDPMFQWFGTISGPLLPEAKAQALADRLARRRVRPQPGLDRLR